MPQAKPNFIDELQAKGMLPTRKSFQDEMKLTAQYAKRLAVAAGSQFVHVPASSDEAPLGFSSRGVNLSYHPAFLDNAAMLATGYNAIRPLIASKGGTPVLPELPVSQQWKDNADKAIKAQDKFARSVGVNPIPANLVEAGIDAVGSVIIPGPKLPATRIVQAAAKDAPVAEKVLRTAGRTAETAARVGAEITIPTRQTKMGEAVSAVVPFNVGAMEVLDSVAKMPEYTGVVDKINQIRQAKPEEQAAQLHTVRTIDEILDPEVKAMYDHATEIGDTETQQIILSKVYEAQQQDIVDQEQGPTPAWRNWAAAGAALAGTGLGLYGVRSILSEKAANALANPTAPSDSPKAALELGGVRTQENGTSAADRATTAMSQADQPIRAATDKLSKSKDEVKRWRAAHDRITAPAMNSVFHSAMVTGHLPNSKITSKVPLGSFLDAFAKDVSPEEWTVVRDGLLAQTALEDYRNNKVLSTFAPDNPNDPQQVAERVQQLTGNVARMKNDPRLSKYGEQVVQFYKDLLDYQLEQGLISQARYDQMRKSGASYVPLRRADKQVSSIADALWTDVGEQQSAPGLFKDLMRSNEAAGGVKLGEAADPINLLADYTYYTIRSAEINSVKRQFLDLAATNKLYGGLIKPIAAKTEKDLKTLEGMHSVRVNGETKFYKVDDPALDFALRYMPNAATNVVEDALRGMKTVSQAGTTGLLNPLFALLKSGAYDATASYLLRPEGYDMGLINQVINSTLKDNQGPVLNGVKEWLSRLDPTVWLNSPIGIVRRVYDDTLLSIADNLTQELIKDGGPLSDLINSPLGQKLSGGQTVSALRDKFAAAYDASITSIMDELGASNTGVFNPNAAAEITAGIKNVAPVFADEASRRAYEAARKGDISAIENVIIGTARGIDNNWLLSSAPKIARFYANFVRTFHEGNRYQAFATNLPKVINDEEAQKILAAQTRRLGGDVGQQGSAGSAVGRINQSLRDTMMYYNVGVQTMAQYGYMARKEPVQTALNTSTFLIGAATLSYLAMANDPKLREEVMAEPMSKRTREVVLPGGIRWPVDQVMRPIWGPVQAALDEMTGMSSGNPDPNMIAAFQHWFEDDGSFSDQSKADINSAFVSGLNDASPLNMSSMPAINVFMAALGQENSFAKFGDSSGLREIKPQGVSALGGDGQYVDDVLSARASAMINDLFGSAISNAMRVGQDALRAYGETGSLDAAAKQAVDRATDNTVKEAKSVAPLLFNGYVTANPASDRTTEYWFKKREGLDKAEEVYQKNIKNAYVTQADPRYASLRSADTVDPRAFGTQLEPIARVTAIYQRYIDKIQRQYGALTRQAEDIRNGKTTSIEDRNAKLNDIYAQRSELAAQMLSYAQQAEDTIRQQIGDPGFTYENFDPKNYMKPLPVPPLSSFSPPSFEQNSQPTSQ